MSFSIKKSIAPLLRISIEIPRENVNFQGGSMKWQVSGNFKEVMAKLDGNPGRSISKKFDILNRRVQFVFLEKPNVIFERLGK